MLTGLFIAVIVNISAFTVGSSDARSISTEEFNVCVDILTNVDIDITKEETQKTYPLLTRGPSVS